MGDVRQVAISPDSAYLAVDGGISISVYRLDTFELVHTFINSPGDWARSMAFSPDGELLALASSGFVFQWDAATVERTSAWHGSVRLWDLATGELVHTLADGRLVHQVIFAPDGATLASTGHDYTIIWDVATGKQLRSFRSSTGGPRGVAAFSPDSATLALTSAGSVGLWDIETGKKLHTLADETPIHYLIFSPDGAKLASISVHSTILWDVATGEQLYTFNPARFHGGDMDFAPDGTTLVYNDYVAVPLWDVAVGEPSYNLYRMFDSYTGRLYCTHKITVSSDEMTLAFSRGGNNVILWDVAVGKRVHTLEGHATCVRSIAFSPDGATLVSAERDAVILWDLTGEPLRRLEGHSGAVVGVAFAPDVATLASGSGSTTISLPQGTVLVYGAGDATATGEQLRVFVQANESVRSVAFAPNGATLALGAENGDITLWDLATGARLRTLAGHYYRSKLSTARQSDRPRTLVRQTTPAYSLAFAPDGATLASGSVNGNVVLWNVATGARLHTLAAHNGWVSSLAFSPDGANLAASAGFAGAVVWDVATGEQLRTFTFPVPYKYAHSVALSPDGKLAALVSKAGAAVGEKASDTGIVVWDVATGRPLYTLEYPFASKFPLIFSPDGSILTSRSFPGVFLWNAATGGQLCVLQGYSAPVYSLAFSPDGAQLAAGARDGTVILWDTCNVAATGE